jgi:hypothetical protein
MDALIFHVVSWPALGCALLVYGFAPGALLRLIVLLYPRDHPRRRELIGELYAYPRIKRPFWVAEQLETALFEGLGGRLMTWRAERQVLAQVYIRDPEGGVVTLVLSLAAKFKRADRNLDQLQRSVFEALSGHSHIVHCGFGPSKIAAELEFEYALFEVPRGEGLLGQLQRRLGYRVHLEDRTEGACLLWLKWL